MMGQASMVALVVVVLAVGAGLSQTDQDPTGAATGHASQPSLWTQLAQYEDSFLRSRSGTFEKAAPTPVEVLSTFNALGYAVTGYGGFWRSTVAVEWLGCSAYPGAPACVQVEQALMELRDWDDYLAKIASVSDREAGRFLARNGHRMHAYLARFVPVEASRAGMQQTGFYKARLATVLTADL